VDNGAKPSHNRLFDDDEDDLFAPAVSAASKKGLLSLLLNGY